MKCLELSQISWHGILSRKIAIFEHDTGYKIFRSTFDRIIMGDIPTPTVEMIYDSFEIQS